MEVPIGTCGWLVDKAGVRLAGGAAQLADGGKIELNGDESLFTDFTNDGVGDALLMFDCDGGGVHVWTSLVAIVDNNPPFVLDDDQVLKPSGLPKDSTFHDWGLFSYDGSRFDLGWAGAAPSDGECCPQYSMSSVGTIDKSGFHAESTTGESALTGDKLVLNGNQPKPATTVKVAACVSKSEMHVGMPGPDPEVALLQTKLVELGYNPGDVDGYFGQNTWGAAANSQAQYADGSSGGNGIFTDEQAIAEPLFSRLGIHC